MPISTSRCQLLHLAILQCVTFTCFGTYCNSLFVKFEFMSRFAHPPGLSCRISHNQGIVRYLPGNNSACSDESVLANVVAADDGSIRADGSTFSNMSACVLRSPVNGTPWIDDICEHHRRPQKYIVIAGDTRVNRHVVLYLDVVAQDDFR